MSDGGVDREADLGPRRLVASKSRQTKAVLPMAGAFISCLALPRALAIVMVALLVPVVILLFLQAAYPAIVTMDEKGFTIQWLRSRRVRWADCSPFTIYHVGDFVRARTGSIRASVRYKDSRYARRHPIRAWFVAVINAGNDSILPELGDLSAEEIAWLFNRYREAYRCAT